MQMVSCVHVQQRCTQAVVCYCKTTGMAKVQAAPPAQLCSNSLDEALLPGADLFCSSLHTSTMKVMSRPSANSQAAPSSRPYPGRTPTAKPLRCLRQGGKRKCWQWAAGAKAAAAPQGRLMPQQICLIAMPLKPCCPPHLVQEGGSSARASSTPPRAPSDCATCVRQEQVEQECRGMPAAYKHGDNRCRQPPRTAGAARRLLGPHGS